MKRLNLEGEKKVSSKSKSIIKLVASVVFVALVLEIWVVNSLSTYGNRLAEIKKSEQELIMENQILENQVASYGSLRNIEDESRALGFSASLKFDYIKPAALASTI